MSRPLRDGPSTVADNSQLLTCRHWLENIRGRRVDYIDKPDATDIQFHNWWISWSLMHQYCNSFWGDGVTCWHFMIHLSSVLGFPVYWYILLILHTIENLDYGVTTVIPRSWMMISLWKHDICLEWLPSMNIRRMACLLDVESSHWMRYGADWWRGAGEKKRMWWVGIKRKAELTLIEDLLQRKPWMRRRMAKKLQKRMFYIRMQGEREICVEHQWR